ncbi:hypothetical protein E2320_020376, partial [Naja naja]
LNLKQQRQELQIQKIPVSFYSKLCDHRLSFFAAIVSLVIMFVIQWIYTLINLGLAIILYFYIGKVSLVGFLFLLGLYISSLASCMGGLYGAPRILQCIAQEKVIPLLAFLGHGKGPNKTPVAAICLTSLITMAFIFIGQVNVLASIVTINFMLTYIAVDYSYFSVSMSYNLKQNSKRMRQEDARAVLSCSRPLILSKSTCYGSNGTDQRRSDGTLLEFTKDMNHLFKPVSQDPGTDLELKENNVDAVQVIKQRRQKKAAKQTLEDSFNNIAHIQEPCNDSLRSSVKNAQHFSQPNCQDVDGNDASPSVVRENSQKEEDGDQHLDEMRKASSPQMEDLNLKQQRQNYKFRKYQFLSIPSFVIIGFPFCCVAANFSLFKWIKLLLLNACRGRPSPEERFVVTPTFATVGMETTQLTEENTDFASRDRYHHSSVITREELVHQFQ